MAFFDKIDGQVTALRTLLGADAVADRLTSGVAALGDSDLLATVRHADAVARAAERVRIIAAGVVAARSTRAAGHSGLAQS